MTARFAHWAGELLADLLALVGTTDGSSIYAECMGSLHPSNEAAEFSAPPKPIARSLNISMGRCMGRHRNWRFIR